MAISGSFSGVFYRKLSYLPYKQGLENISASSLNESSLAQEVGSNALFERIEAHRRSHFLCRIPQEKWEELTKKVQLIEPQSSEEDLQAFQNGKWNHEAFMKPEWIVSAFSQYLEDRIDQDTMCKLFLYDACQTHILEENNPEVPRLQRKQLFVEQNYYNLKAVQKLQCAVSSYLTQDQFKVFLNYMASIEPSRTQFFLLRRNCDPLLQMIATIKESPLAGFFVFPSKGRANSVWQLIASSDFVYRIFWARFLDQAMKPSPSVGYRAIEKLSDPNFRVMGIPFFDLLPNTVHGLQASPLSFYHHEIYHLAIESANSHRPLWIQIALFAKKEKLDWMVPLLLDRELESYLKNRRPIEAHNFWLSVFSFVQVLEAYNRKIEKNKFSPGDPTQIFMDMFLKFFHLEQKRLSEKWGITCEDLKGLLSDREAFAHISGAARLFLKDLYSRLSSFEI
jgi:hypothetical protein